MDMELRFCRLHKRVWADGTALHMSGFRGFWTTLHPLSATTYRLSCQVEDALCTRPLQARCLKTPLRLGHPRLGLARCKHRFGVRAGHFQRFGHGAQARRGLMRAPIMASRCCAAARLDIHATIEHGHFGAIDGCHQMNFIHIAQVADAKQFASHFGQSATQGQVLSLIHI